MYSRPCQKVIYRNREGGICSRYGHYFQAHKIIIPSSFPLDNIFKNPEAIGRIGKWAIKINDFVIEFVRRNAIKSQALAD
jgi:hypothetical protein